MFWLFLAFWVVLMGVLAFLAVSKPQSLEVPMTQLQEALGYPGPSFLQNPSSNLQFVNEDTRVFVVVSTLPDTVGQTLKALASIPNHVNVRKIVVVDPDAKQSKPLLEQLELAVQVIPAKFKGPLGKLLTVTDPAVSMLLGLTRGASSHDILVSLDDDMYQHQTLVQNLVTGIEQSLFEKVVVHQMNLDLSTDDVPIQNSKWGIAQPARLWTSAFRGDVLHLQETSKVCVFSDDVPMSVALKRNRVCMVKLAAVDYKYALPSSSDLRQGSKGLHSECLESLRDFL